MGHLRIVGLGATLAGVALHVLSLPGVVIVVPGLLVLLLGRVGAAGTKDNVDRAIGVAGLLLLASSVFEPMYWLIPSLPMIVGALLVLLSGLWRFSDVVLGLFVVPMSLLTLAAVILVPLAGSQMAGPHGPVVLVFVIASLYGLVSATTLGVALMLRARGGQAAQVEGGVD